jgi:hypothetical protein
MKKTPRSKPTSVRDRDLRAEYRFDYSKARSNRFAARWSGDCQAVVLDPDVARVFNTPESVNRVLRAIIESFPGAHAPKAIRKSKGK